MPDFDLAIEIANYFDVGIEELLDGERKMDMIEKKQEETLLKVADYGNNERIAFSKRLRHLQRTSAISFYHRRHFLFSITYCLSILLKDTAGIHYLV